jgi:hypothetical protein
MFIQYVKIVKRAREREREREKHIPVTRKQIIVTLIKLNHIKTITRHDHDEEKFKILHNFFTLFLLHETQIR